MSVVEFVARRPGRFSKISQQSEKTLNDQTTLFDFSYHIMLLPRKSAILK